MKLVTKFAISILFLCTVQNAHCSDSLYIQLAWGGDVDKPYYEFLFHKAGSWYPDDQHGSPFVFICQLNDEQFRDLKTILIDDATDRGRKVSSNEWCTHYFLGYFSGWKVISGANILDQNDLVRVSRLMKNYFKESKFSDEINWRWEQLFARVGIKER